LKFAESYGYSFEIIEGYHYPKSANIFKTYVETLYSLRKTYHKSDSRNYVCKLLLNSLYGRFGMSPTIMEYKICSSPRSGKHDSSHAAKRREGLDEEMLESIYQVGGDIQEIGDIILNGIEVHKNILEDFKFNRDIRISAT